MSDEITLSDEQIQSIARAVVAAGHKCRFDEAESKSLHRFAQSIENGGWAKWNAILDFGGTLITMKKVGIVTIWGMVLTTLAGAVWAGLKMKLGGNQ